jgi:hypothetical protein
VTLAKKYIQDEIARLDARIDEAGGGGGPLSQIYKEYPDYFEIADFGNGIAGWADADVVDIYFPGTYPSQIYGFYSAGVVRERKIIRNLSDGSIYIWNEDWGAAAEDKITLKSGDDYMELKAGELAEFYYDREQLKWVQIDSPFLHKLILKGIWGGGVWSAYPWECALIQPPSNSYTRVVVYDTNAKDGDLFAIKSVTDSLGIIEILPTGYAIEHPIEGGFIPASTLITIRKSWFGGVWQFHYAESRWSLISKVSVGVADRLVDKTYQTSDGSSHIMLSESNIPTNMAAHVRATVWARQSAGTGTGDCAKYVIEALVVNSGGSLLIIKDENVVSMYEDQPAWDVWLSYSGTTLYVEVRGEASKTIQWRCQLEVSVHV